jgi:hypothetical protein
VAQVLADVPLVPRARTSHHAHGRWHSLLTEVVFVAAGIVAYFSARGLTEANPAKAIEHSHEVVDFEKWSHLYHEPFLQGLIIGHETLIDVLNWIYIWGHWPVIIVTLVWLVHSHPAPYRILRNAFFVSGMIGVCIFVLYPVAPPRLAGLGLYDTVSAQSHAYRVLQPPAFVNQYAAVPSLHVGWNLLIGIFVVRYARRTVLRVIGALLPMAMTASVVLTANHYVIDAVLGAIVALTGLVVAMRMARSP